MRTELIPKPKPLERSISEEMKVLNAKEAQARIEALMDEIKANEGEMFRLMADLIGLPDESDRHRLVWGGLARFANEALTGQGVDTDAVTALRAAIALSLRGDEEFRQIQGEVFGLEFFDDVYRQGKELNCSLVEAFHQLATNFHASIRNVLEWVADPNRLAPDKREAALGFLVKHSQQENAKYDFDVNAEFDDTGNVGYPLFYWKNPAGFQTICAPIALFIFERLERYHERELRLEEAVPIVLCRREQCDRLALIQRKSRDFCSDSCRARQRQKDKAVEHAEYMRNYRRKNYTKPTSKGNSAEG